VLTYWLERLFLMKPPALIKEAAIQASTPENLFNVR